MDPASGQPRPTSTCALRERRDLRGVVPSGWLPGGPNLPSWTGFSAEPEFLPLPSSLLPLRLKYRTDGEGSQGEEYRIQEAGVQEAALRETASINDEEDAKILDWDQ